MKCKISRKKICPFCKNFFATFFPKQSYCDARCRYKNWCKKNPEREREIRLNSRKKHLVARTIYNRNYYLRHKSDYRLRQLNWRRTHKEEANHRTIQRCRRVRANGGSFSFQEWQTLKKSFNFRCAICKKRKPLTRDHIIPISHGGTNHVGNIQPLCGSCNSSKGNRLNFSKT